MNADRIHIRELIGRRVAALYKAPVAGPADGGKYDGVSSDGFVEFVDGLVVKLEGAMEVERLTHACLPAGCAPLFAAAGDPGPGWDVVDAGSDSWYLSFCLLLASNQVLGVKQLSHWHTVWFEPCSAPFDPEEMQAWLRGPLPAAHARDWWEGPCGAYVTAAELEAHETAS